MGINQEFVLTQLWTKLLWLQQAFCDEKWCLTFHTWCLTFLREREYFLYQDIIPIVLLIFLLPSQPMWTLAVQDMMLLCLWTIFSCMCTYISSLKFLKVYVYKIHNLSLLLNIHMWDHINAPPLPFFFVFVFLLRKWPEGEHDNGQCFFVLTLKEIFSCW